MVFVSSLKSKNAVLSKKQVGSLLVDATYLAQHIATALYVTVDHIEAHEPLVRSLKESTAQLVDLLKIGGKREFFAHRVFDVASHLSTLLTVLVRVDRIQSENKDILVEFLYKLQTIMVLYVQSARNLAEEISKVKKSAPDGASIFSSIKNQPSIAELRAILEKGLPSRGLKTMEKTIASPLGVFSYDYGDSKASLNNKDTSLVQKNSLTVKNTRSYHGAHSHTTRAMTRREDRMKEIIKIVQQLRVVAMKDIAIRITSCSEKTLQRDVAELLKQKALTKQGQRRWATYKIGLSN